MFHWKFEHLDLTLIDFDYPRTEVTEVTLFTLSLKIWCLMNDDNDFKTGDHESSDIYLILV